MAGFRTLPLAVTLSALLLGAQAAHASPEVAVLGLEVIDGGEGLDQQTTQRAAWLTDELRDYVANEDSPYGLAPRGNKDLLEMKLLSGCADEALECMAAIGRELGADRLLYGKLQKGERGYRVSLVLLDTGRPAVESSISDQIPFTEASKSAMGAWARSVYNELTGVAAGGVLIVETNAASGTVFVDGQPQASVVNGAARVEEIEEGIRTISIEADGYAPYAERVTIVPGQEELMAIELDRLDTPSAPSKTPYRIGFGTALAATGASTGAWAVTYYQLRYTLERDKEDAVDRMKALGGSDEDYGPSANVCESAEGDVGSSNPEIAAVAGELVTTCDKGHRRALLAPIFGTAAAVSALATGYFYYKGFMGGGGVERAPSSGDSWSLRVGPRFGPDLVGAGLRLEF